MRSSPAVCAGPCGHTYRQAEAGGDDTTALRVFYGNPHWCQVCAGRVADALAQMPRLLDDIRDDAVHATPVPGEKVRHTASHASAPGESATILHDLITTELLWFEDQMRVLRGWTPRVDGPDSDTTRSRPTTEQASAAISVLTRSLDWLLEGHPDAADPDRSPGAQILAWRRTAERFTRQDRPREAPRNVPCPRCDQNYTLVMRPGEDRVECGDPNCRAVMTIDEYDTWCKRLRLYWQGVKQTSDAA